MCSSDRSDWSDDRLGLADRLAIFRTLLANERTLLAYLRSGVALIIAGVTIIQFSEPGWFQVLGIVCLPTGLLSGMIGIARYRRMSELIALVRRGATHESTACDDSVP